VGSRLNILASERAKPAVPFGGAYRIIDFTLSNCVNSGIRQVFVLIQYRSTSLLRHIQEGWSISSSGLGDYIYCIPAQQKLGADWYRGTADAVRQNLDLIRGRDIDHVLILSGDHTHNALAAPVLQAIDLGGNPFDKTTVTEGHDDSCVGNKVFLAEFHLSLVTYLGAPVITELVLSLVASSAALATVLGISWYLRSRNTFCPF
jgi:hypothetical protein